MKVFLTGGTGSLGHALLDFFQTSVGPFDVTVYSRDEIKQSEMRRIYPDARYMLGDVRDYDRLLLAMRGHHTVIHAAAYKQVPSAEANVNEAIATNVMGSLNVARAAVHNDVDNVVGVSTDKACQPINAYGETKALMEKLFQQADGWGETIFNCVRYGNVLGSRGSVVPLFREQLKQKHVTMTDANMTRFWMTLDQAVDLVWAAINPHTTLTDGSILVPACPASNMLTLLLAVAKIEGVEVAPDWVTTIGTRPGEKKHEQLIHENESLHTMLPLEGLPYWQILPAAFMAKAPPTPFSYSSDVARQLTADELAEMLVDA